MAKSKKYKRNTNNLKQRLELIKNNERLLKEYSKEN
jgi:hypothetical protein